MANITGIFVDKCIHSKKLKYKRDFVKKYWCNLRNKLCLYVEMNDCRYEAKND